MGLERTWLKTVARIGFLVLLLVEMSFCETIPSRVVLKTCKGCALGKYPAVIMFIKYDSPLYSLLSVNDKAGGRPRLVLLDEHGESIKTLDISLLKLKDIRNVLKQIGLEPSEPLLPIKYVLKKYKEDQLLAESKNIINSIDAPPTQDKQNKNKAGDDDVDL